MRERILELAGEQFTRFGVRTVTMEDIARLAGISKKTIYQEFKDKKDLVKEAFKLILERDKEQLQFIVDSEDRVIEHLVKSSQTMRERLEHMNPIAILEVQKYFPDAWAEFESFKEDFVLKDIYNVIERGKTLGYFRPEIDSMILARLRVNQVSSVFDSGMQGRTGLEVLNMQLELMDHFLHGIFTEKGRLAYNQKKEITN
ncbi:MAG: TetR/AcrR family transcriptional regulator [Algoriphagus sp.]|uniref:TetR/AcrR family transcriptional regulator n=1 Tax=Algoriphagus sp. TaxID=1872435 RepID=UPI002604A647|nr:TetR/AcrR family transcriptional regulator [Algoriphagus sp.]MDG1277812.1 TetR/AcrR family transcriptional regulator [Algoriphagus sp.]